MYHGGQIFIEIGDDSMEIWCSVILWYREIWHSEIVGLMHWWIKGRGYLYFYSICTIYFIMSCTIFHYFDAFI